MADILFDLRYAARTLARQPMFAAGVAMTLALGLGLNAMVLGMMDALLFRPFQFADADRLIVAFETPKAGSAREPVAPGHSSSGGDAPHLLVEDAPVQDAASRPTPGFRAVSAGYFETMGIPIVQGRTFSSVDRDGRRSQRRRQHARRAVVAGGSGAHRGRLDRSAAGDRQHADHGAGDRE